MGNCVSNRDEVREYRMEKSKKRRIDQPVPNNGKRESCKALLAPPEMTSANGSRRNLFKTFSDWSDETPAAEISRLQDQEVRRRRGSANIEGPMLKQPLKNSSSSEEAKQHGQSSLTSSGKVGKQKRQRRYLQ